MSGADPVRVALVGLRASGKSRVGAALATRLGVPFVDLDRELARLARARGVRADDGMRTARAGDVLRALGEPAFRAIECEALARVAARGGPCVLATGGGVVESAAARAELARWRVVWLDPPLDLLRARLARSTEDRPPLVGGRDAAAELETLAERRRPWYASLAALRVVPEGDGETPRALAGRVADALGLACGGARLARRRARRYPRLDAHGDEGGR